MVELTCKMCNNTYPRTTEYFYVKSSKGYTHTYCKTCLNRMYAQKQKNVKIDCVNYKGGKCEFCGYDKCISALEFHHKDPKQKDFGLATYIRKNKKLKDLMCELDKCLLLCANCHREEHDRLNKVGLLGNDPSSTV